jgi:hypothetical protein
LQINKFMVSNATITTMDLHVGEVVNYMDYLEHTQRPNFKIVIPSLNRPDELCLTTLALLRSHGISLSNVGVFITPTVLAEHEVPEWSRYLAALRRHDMLEVQLLPGAIGLAQQMRKAMEWVGQGHMITMSDTVTDILVRHSRRRSDQQFLAPMSKGWMLPLIHHAHDLMIAGAFTAWSVNPMHNAGRMNSKNLISRKLGLLDGNFSGMLLPSDWKKCWPETVLSTFCLCSCATLLHAQGGLLNWPDLGLQPFSFQSSTMLRILF